MDLGIHLSIQLNPSTSDNYFTTTAKPTTDYVRQSRSDAHFTVEELIETFRKELIEKEINISVVIESSKVFHRHFNLKH